MSTFHFLQQRVHIKAGQARLFMSPSGRNQTLSPYLFVTDDIQNDAGNSVYVDQKRRHLLSQQDLSTARVIYDIFDYAFSFNYYYIRHFPVAEVLQVFYKKWRIAWSLAFKYLSQQLSIFCFPFKPSDGSRILEGDIVNVVQQAGHYTDSKAVCIVGRVIMLHIIFVGLQM